MCPLSSRKEDKGSSVFLGAHSHKYMEGDPIVMWPPKGSINLGKVVAVGNSEV